VQNCPSEQSTVGSIHIDSIHKHFDKLIRYIRGLPKLDKQTLFISEMKILTHLATIYCSPELLDTVMKLVEQEKK
jgi:hypothetical protein